MFLFYEDVILHWIELTFCIFPNFQTCDKQKELKSVIYVMFKWGKSLFFKPELFLVSV